jgi:hypothetical protein
VEAERVQDHHIAEDPLPPFATDVPRPRRGPLVLAALAAAVVIALVAAGLARDREHVEDVATTSGGGPPAAALAGAWTGADGIALPDGSGADGALVVATRILPEACDAPGAVVLDMAVPIGRPTSDPIHTYEYVRDADERFEPPQLRETYAADADLPTNAVPTGFTHRDAELWTSPETLDHAVFLVLPDHVELWPRVIPPITCG